MSWRSIPVRIGVIIASFLTDSAFISILLAIFMIDKEKQLLYLPAHLAGFSNYVLKIVYYILYLTINDHELEENQIMSRVYHFQRNVYFGLVGFLIVNLGSGIWIIMFSNPIHQATEELTLARLQIALIVFCFLSTLTTGVCLWRHFYVFTKVPVEDPHFNFLSNEFSDKER